MSCFYYLVLHVTTYAVPKIDMFGSVLGARTAEEDYYASK